MPGKTDIKNFTLPELKNLLIANDLKQYQARQIFGWIYAKRIEDFSAMSDISKDTRRLLEEKFYFSKLKTVKNELSKDKTEKFLFALEDKTQVESVFIPETGRNTLCVSSQVGCKFNCKFCLSGKLGFKRNLKSSEIINQYLEVSAACAPLKITNLVFMGIGEPLDNFSNVTKAIEILTEPAGIGFSKRRICVSTCGLVEEIKMLSRLKLGIKLSVSLHSADDAVRSSLMPVNKKYPLKELINAVREFSKSETYPVTFEYALIQGLNTGKEDAFKLIKLVRGLNCKINLIPYNEHSIFSSTKCAGKILVRITPERSEGGNESSLKFAQPSPGDISLFCRELKNAGVFFTLRKSRGQDISAACGQLVAAWS
ncbi:MAG: 23S rRNA (adenine(2503)-C(2))-methyltransferase RlmN [Candidatus Omnitrophota bacterium]